MKMLYLLFALVCVAAAEEHDHRKHLDPNFLYKEAIRASYSSLESGLHAIKFLADSIAEMEASYDSKISYTINKPDRFKEAWKLHIEPTYQATVDRLLVIVRVCAEMYKDPRCTIPEEF
jgi:hypothetical protein